VALVELVLAPGAGVVRGCGPTGGVWFNGGTLVVGGGGYAGGGVTTVPTGGVTTVPAGGTAVAGNVDIGIPSDRMGPPEGTGALYSTGHGAALRRKHIGRAVPAQPTTPANPTATRTAPHVRRMTCPRFG
jgi:hypothetical protein